MGGGGLENLGLGEAKFSGRLLNVRRFTKNGTYTPGEGVKSIIVEAQAGGGSGGNVPDVPAGQAAAGSGGGAGAYAKVRITDKALFSSVILSIGEGGGAPNIGMPGINGGNTFFGNLINCPGGAGGGHGRVLTGAGTSSANGHNTVPPTISPQCEILVSLAGEAGGNGLVLNQDAPLAGAGGCSPFGIGGHAPTSPGARTAYGYGAGSSGANGHALTTAQVGLPGMNGIIVVWEYA